MITSSGARIVSRPEHVLDDYLSSGDSDSDVQHVAYMHDSTGEEHFAIDDGVETAELVGFTEGESLDLMETPQLVDESQAMQPAAPQLPAAPHAPPLFFSFPRRPDPRQGPNF